MYSDYATILSNPGDTPPADSGAEISTSQVSDSSNPETEPKQAETPVEAPVSEVTDQVPEVKTESDDAVAVEDPQPADEDDAETTDFDKALSEERPTGKKWADSLISHLKEKLTERETALQTYETAGAPEDVAKFKEFYENFHGFEEKDGQFIPKTEQFANTLLTETPDKAVELINKLVTAPNPMNPSQTIFEAMIATPEVEQYFANKFQAVNDPVLQEVPEEYQQAFQALPQELKETFEIAADDARLAILKQAQRELDLNKQAETLQNERVQQAQQKFQAEIETATQDAFGAVTSQFDESLKQIPFSGDKTLNGFLQQSTKDFILTAATMPGTPAGTQAVEALKQIGITFPSDVPAKVQQVEQLAKQMVTAKTQGNKAAATHYAAELATVQRQLVARTNEISAQIAKKFGTSAKSDAAQKESLLSQTKTRPEINPTSGQQAQPKAYVPYGEFIG